MSQSDNSTDDSNRVKTFFTKYVRFRSSIYSRVVYIITISSVTLFVLFGIIFRTVCEQNFNAVIRQNGNNIGSIVEGSLYHSMLANDKSSLQRTLDIINTMTGIDDVNMYDANDNLVYSSFSLDTVSHSNPNCIEWSLDGAPCLGFCLDKKSKMAATVINN